jgi:hypothetical protein
MPQKIECLLLHRCYLHITNWEGKVKLVHSNGREEKLSHKNAPTSWFNLKILTNAYWKCWLKEYLWNVESYRTIHFTVFWIQSRLLEKTWKPFPSLFVVSRTENTFWCQVSYLIRNQKFPPSDRYIFPLPMEDKAGMCSNFRAASLLTRNICRRNKSDNHVPFNNFWPINLLL